MKNTAETKYQSMYHKQNPAPTCEQIAVKKAKDIYMTDHTELDEWLSRYDNCVVRGAK